MSKFNEEGPWFVVSIDKDGRLIINPAEDSQRPDMSKYCCEKFAQEAGKLQKPIAQFERQEDGTWAINGCCGGGCYVVQEMRFCPFCGSSLTG